MKILGYVSETEANTTTPVGYPLERRKMIVRVAPASPFDEHLICELPWPRDIGIKRGDVVEITVNIGPQAICEPGSRITEIQKQVAALQVELAQLTGEVAQDIAQSCRALLASGNKIGAVKAYRIAMGGHHCSLKDALNYVNALETAGAHDC